MIIHLDSTRFIWEVLENQEYSYMFQDLDVLDLGCNVGAFSLWIYPFVNKLWAVDAEKHHTDNLEKTIADNALTKMRVQNVKIAGTDGVGNVYSLKGFMDGNNIKRLDLLKMDIEGDEMEVVNALDFPADRIKMIVGEHHYQDSRVREFRERLEVLGYRYTEYPNSHFKAVQV